MTMTDTPAVPGVQFTLTTRDANRLDSVLSQFELMATQAFTNGTDLGELLPHPLHIAHVVAKLREAIQANSAKVDVPRAIDSDIAPEPGGGMVYPHLTYTVRHQIGQLNKLDAVQRWTWSIDSESEMTYAEFRAYDIPAQIENDLCVTRCRIQLIDKNGKILRERFGYR